MKLTHYYIIGAMLAGLAACQDGDWDDPQATPASVYGNADIKEGKVVSIAELKQMYRHEVTTSYAYKEVTDDIQLKGWVTGNDVEGNLYNEVMLQDATGAISISVEQGAMHGLLPVGTEILVSLKGLYVGNYGLQPQLGYPRERNGASQLYRMSRYMWQDHFTYTGRQVEVEPEEFGDGATGKVSTTWDLAKDAGKLGVLKNVSFRNVKPGSMYADPDGGASVSWYFKEFNGTSLMLYNSPYADFAAQQLPTGKVNVTGIFKRYNNSWEIIIRSLDDVVPAGN